jgi:hypothetical protein
MTDDAHCPTCAIRATMARYNVAGDRGRSAELAATFTPDGTLDTGYWKACGRGEIAARIADTVDAPHPRLTTVRHHLTTSDITIEEDGTARGRSYFMVLTNEGPDHSGLYLDRFSCVDGTWLIASRAMRLEWTSPGSLLVPR